MTTASIPVDLYNPGQVFACLGLMELAEILCGGTEAGFDWSDPRGVRFLLRADGQDDPIRIGLRFIATAQVQALAPHGSGLDTEKWQVPCDATRQGDPFPVPAPASPASLPAVLVAGQHQVVVDSWGDVRRPGALASGRDNVKFWAGSGGYPGVALMRDAIESVRPRIEDARPDPFALSAPQTSSFRFDWRRDYIPIDAGFSLNEHSRITPRGYPLVEILAAIGLAHARPARLHKLHYRYAVAGHSRPVPPDTAPLLPPPFVRAALGAPPLPFPTRTFTMHLGWPGKEGQARCITTVTEEAAP